MEKYLYDAQELKYEIEVLKGTIKNDDEQIIFLQDKLHRRNMQIKDLKAQINSNISAKTNLHSRIDVLEKIVKDNNLWETYCLACDNNRYDLKDLAR